MLYDRRMELRDGNLLLRPMGDGDAAAVRDACQDPEIPRWIPVIPSPYTLEDATEFTAAAKRNWAEGTTRNLAIIDTAADELLGSISVRLGEIGAIGYWVKREARGRGVASRALMLLSRWALTEGGVERLQLTTHPDNIASQRVAENAGFQYEGALRSHLRYRDGRRRDSFLFSLLPSDLG